MLDLRLLKTFLAVAAGLSFRKAAQDLHYAPSTVTSQIKALEDELGHPLFDRTGRRVLLTEHGQRLLRHARRLVDLEAETRRLLSGDGDGPAVLGVRISASLGAYCMPWVLPRFREGFADTRLALATHSRNGLVHDLRSGVMDVALLLSEPFSAPGLLVETLGKEPLAVIAEPDSPLTSRREVRPADLEGATLILTRHVWSVRASIEQALLADHVGLSGLVECSSVEIVKRLVIAGQGVSVVPGFTVADEVCRGQLIALPWAGGPLAVPVLLVRDGSRWLSPAAGLFIETVRAFFAVHSSAGRVNGAG